MDFLEIDDMDYMVLMNLVKYIHPSPQLPQGNQLMKSQHIVLFTLIISLASLTSCYRMPREDEYSVTPTTNNPQIHPQKKSNSFLPGVGY